MVFAVSFFIHHTNQSVVFIFLYSITLLRSASKGSRIVDMLLPPWSIKVMMQNCSCDIMGTCSKTGQYYPILNTYIGQLEIDVSGFQQGTRIPDLYVCLCSAACI